jgi:hypothetical protein
MIDERDTVFPGSAPACSAGYGTALLPTLEVSPGQSGAAVGATRRGERARGRAREAP